MLWRSPSNPKPGFGSDSAFHRAKLPQGDQGINPGQQKMRPMIFPALPAAWHSRRHAPQLTPRLDGTRKTVGYQERFAQETLGRNSRAVHRAYTKRALMKTQSLEDYKQRATTKAETAA